MKISGNPKSKVLLKWCKKNEEKVYEIHHGRGYSTESGDAYDILLNRGWCWEEDGCHTIIEETASDTLKALRDVKECKCHDCLTGEGW